MNSEQLIEILEQYPKNIKFTSGIIIQEDGTIDHDFTSGVSTVKDVIKELKRFPSDSYVVDIDDGYVYRTVTGIIERYWSKNENRLEFNFKH